MSELAIILKRLREKRGITQQKLVELSGLGQGTIGDIERGKIKKGSTTTLEKISKALNLDEEEKNELFSVLLPKGMEVKSSTNRQEAFNLEKAKVNTVMLPVYGKASAGNGYINLENEIYFMPVMKGNFSKKSFLVEVHGDSMQPTLKEGDFVLVDPLNSDYVENKIYVITYNDESFIKRIKADDKNKMIILISDNRDYDNIYISYEEREDIKIKGRVVQVLRNWYL